MIVPSEDHYTYMQRHPENNSFRTIKNIYQGQRTPINKNTFKNTGPPQATIDHPRPKNNSAQFYDPYDHIHHMKHTHENTHHIDTQE